MALLLRFNRVSKFLPNTTTRSFSWTTHFKGGDSAKSNDSGKSFRKNVESTIQNLEQAALEIRKLHKDYKQLNDSDLLTIKELCKLPLKNFWIKVEGCQCALQMIEDEDNRYYRIDMPGIGKKGIKMRMENGELHLCAEELWDGVEYSTEDYLRRYSGSIRVDSGLYQTDKIKADIKNGMLRIVIPKIKNKEEMNPEEKDKVED